MTLDIQNDLTSQTAHGPAATANGLEPINEVVAEMYRAISFEEDGQPDWAAMRSVFAEDALITRLTPEGVDRLDREGFMAMAHELLEVGAYTSFHEAEVVSRTTIIGNIASRVSVYETRSCATASRVLSRGVNLIQLREDSGSWRVHSLLWQEELDTALQAGLEKAMGWHV